MQNFGGQTKSIMVFLKVAYTHVKETKIWQPLKTWGSISVPRCAAYHKGN